MKNPYIDIFLTESSKNKTRIYVNHIVAVESTGLGKINIWTRVKKFTTSVNLEFLLALLEERRQEKD